MKGYRHLAVVSWNTWPANTSRRCSITSPCFAVNIQILLWLVIRSGSWAIIPTRTRIELISSILKTHTIVFSHPADGENRFTRLCLSASHWSTLIGRFSIGQSNLPLARCGSCTQNFASFLWLYIRANAVNTVVSKGTLPQVLELLQSQFRT